MSYDDHAGNLFDGPTDLCRSSLTSLLHQVAIWRRNPDKLCLVIGRGPLRYVSYQEGYRWQEYFRAVYLLGSSRTSTVRNAGSRCDGVNVEYSAWNGADWDTEPVRTIESIRQWGGVAAHGSSVWMAGTNEDGTLWLVERDGNSWADRPLDVSQLIQLEASFHHAISAGPAGLAITFGSNPRTYVAWQPAGSETFQISEVGEMYTSVISSATLRVGASTSRAAAIHDLRISVWGLSAPLWPRIASFPLDDAECTPPETVAMTLDASDRPVLVSRSCGGILEIYRQVGEYPEKWDQGCQAAITQLCDLACDCGPVGDCAYVYSTGLSPGGNRSGCELSARDNLCGDSTSTPDELAACVATLEPATCGELGYPVDDACVPLVE